MLPFALHGYRTSVRTSTGATPFSLVYGMEVVLPFEVEVSSLRILAESRLKESEWAQTRFDQLNLIEGKRLAAMSHGRLYRKWVKNAFDKKVRSRRFNEGDLVLKKVSQALKDNREKWASNYEGPFVVTSFTRELRRCQAILRLRSGAIKEVFACFLFFVVSPRDSCPL